MGAPSVETPERLPPTPSTLRELYLLSGNRCILPDCRKILVSSEGTFTGRVAHIKGVMPKSARHDPSQTNEQRRQGANLVLTCADCHDIIDDLANVSTYTVAYLQKLKERREQVFRHGLEELINSVGDVTDISRITPAQNLRALGYEFEDADDANLATTVAWAQEIAERLRRLPLNARGLLASIIYRGTLRVSKGGHASSPIEVNLMHIKHAARRMVEGSPVGEPLSEHTFCELLVVLEDADFVRVEEGVLVQTKSSFELYADDLFEDIKKAYPDDLQKIRSIIRDLDFSILDK